MKATFDRKRLLQALQVLNGCTASRGMRPILQCVRMSASLANAHLTTTDLEKTGEAIVAAETVEIDGTIVVPIAPFVAALKSSKVPSVTVESDGTCATVTCGPCVSRIAGEPVADFPEQSASDVSERASRYVMGRAGWRMMHAATAFAASRELGRYGIDGVNVEVNQTRVRMTTTDGRRLARADLLLLAACGEDVHGIIPLSAATTFAAMVDASDDATMRLAMETRPKVYASRAESLAVKVDRSSRIHRRERRRSGRRGARETLPDAARRSRDPRVGPSPSSREFAQRKLFRPPEVVRPTPGAISLLGFSSGRGSRRRGDGRSRRETSRNGVDGRLERVGVGRRDAVVDAILDRRVERRERSLEVVDLRHERCSDLGELPTDGLELAYPVLDVRHARRIVAVVTGRTTSPPTPCSRCGRPRAAPRGTRRRRWRRRA